MAARIPSGGRQPACAWHNIVELRGCVYTAAPGSKFCRQHAPRDPFQERAELSAGAKNDG